MSSSYKKSNYNQRLAVQEFMKEMAEAFGEYDDRNGSDSNLLTLNALAAEFHITPLKARKLLITAGVYSTATSRRVAELTQSGMTIQQVMEATGLSRASVHSYLPYAKLPYKLGEESPGGERAKKCRGRKTVCKNFAKNLAKLEEKEQDAALWEALTLLQGSVFYTAKGLKFTYELKGGEMFVNRKEKSITQASVSIAFHKALELGEQATGPKKLGTFGASYLYPIFVKLGIIVKPA